jgi:hypothetical protein
MSRPTAPNSFLNGPNYQKIVGFLRQHYTAKMNVQAIPERMDSRIQKTVQHYMTEVARLQGVNKALNVLNQEVLRETTASMDNWVRKHESATAPTTTSIGAFSRPNDEYNRLFEDTNTRYESLMADRTSPAAAPMPVVPDFRVAKDEMDEEDPVLLMQRMQKQRDDQARVLGINTTVPAPSNAPPRLEIREEFKPSAANPVPPQADAPPPLLAPRPQDYIIPQEDIVKYRETEYNIFVTSSDRDWLRNSQENRYNFSVIMNPGNSLNGFAYNTGIRQRFRNIQRVEFVKAIVPIESLTSLVRVIGVSDGGDPIYDTSRVVNVFSFPFSSVRIAELDSNGFSTNPEEDNTFAVVQYDTTWSSDLTVPTPYGGSSASPATKSGYTGLIPKFIKCQRVYSPTPKDNLQKLTIRLERHNNELLSGDSDVQFVARIGLSGTLTSIGLDNTNYAVSPSIPNPYVFLKTNNYFLHSAISEGDLINVKGFTVVRVGAPADSTCVDFETWVNRGNGHYVIAVGYLDSSNNIQLGRNDAGYCNIIILRSRFNDPTVNNSSINTLRTQSYFGGSTVEEGLLASQLDTQAVSTGTGLINISRQVHVVLRIVTRDFDAGSNIRPDNV